MRLRPVHALLGGVALAVSACGAPTDSTSASPAGSAGSTSASVSSSASSSGTASAPSCSKDTLKVVKAGTLTVGTDKPAYPPWFIDDTPSNGKGYESAVAYAIAKQLGFEASQVTWTTVPFNSAVAPGPKQFDFDVNQISISDKRKQAVDFSSGYYDVRQTVITYKGSPIDGKTSVTDLAGAKLGAQVGTTSYTAITDQIKATQKPAVFDTNDLAAQALKNKQVDGIVVDLPTAFYMTAAQIDNGVIVGQLPAGSGAVEQFGAVLDKDSPLTECVTWAVDSLRADGTLKKLEAAWLAKQGAPELK